VSTTTPDVQPTQILGRSFSSSLNAVPDRMVERTSRGWMIALHSSFAATVSLRSCHWLAMPSKQAVVSKVDQVILASLIDRDDYFISLLP
jgi:hypothetical protein